MRLIDESVMEGGHLTPEERIALQAEEIKQLWQENEQLRAKLDEWKYEVKCHMDEVIAREKQMERLRKSIESLLQENRQLRDTLRDAKCEICNMPCLCYGDRKCDRCKTIEDIDKVLGGRQNRIPHP